MIAFTIRFTNALDTTFIFMLYSLFVSVSLSLGFPHRSLFCLFWFLLFSLHYCPFLLFISFPFLSILLFLYMFLSQIILNQNIFYSTFNYLFLCALLYPLNISFLLYCFFSYSIDNFRAWFTVILFLFFFFLFQWIFHHFIHWPMLLSYPPYFYCFVFQFVLLDYLFFICISIPLSSVYPAHEVGLVSLSFLQLAVMSFCFPAFLFSIVAALKRYSVPRKTQFEYLLECIPCSYYDVLLLLGAGCNINWTIAQKLTLFGTKAYKMYAFTIDKEPL